MNSKNKGFQAKKYFGIKISRSRIYFNGKAVKHSILFIFSFFLFGKISTLSAQATIDSTSNYSTFGVSCFGGNDGWIAASATGGTPPYTYEWTKAGVIVGTTPIITGLDEGFYNLNVTDNLGVYIGNTGHFLNQPTELQTLTQVDLQYTGEALSCAGATDAKAWAYSWSGAVSVTTGVAPYTYQWSNGLVGDTLRNVGAGTYTVTTTDGNGCTVVNSLTITNPPGKSITITEDNPISCEGGSDGIITSLITGGNGTETFLWSSGDTVASAVGLSAGIYTVTATDANGCSAIGIYDLSDGPDLSVIFGITPPSCGGSDGQLIAIPTGGNPPYISYNWNTGVTGTTITNLSEGIYTVTVYDNRGCSAEVSHQLISANVFYTTFDAGAATSTPCPAAPSSCTYTYNGGSCSNVTVNSGEFFCINSGVFTCNVTFNGGTVYVAPGATFSPNNSNNFSGTIINCGTTNFTTSLFDSGSNIQNYGQMNFPNATFNTTQITNYFGASIYINSNVILGQPTTIDNYGTLEINGSLTIQRGILNNYFDVFLNNTFIIETSNSELNNYGRVAAQRDIFLNADAKIVNECSLVALRDIIINASFTNNGLLHANNRNSLIRVNGGGTTFVNDGEVITQNFINNASLFGSGTYWTFATTQQNGSSIGTDGNGLNFYDATFDENGNGNQIFDQEAGIIDPSVTKDPPTSAFPDLNTIPDRCANGFSPTVCPGTTLSNINTKILGGTPPFTYAWGNGATTASLTNVPDGMYSLTVTDANSCDQVIDATINVYQEDTTNIIDYDGISNFCDLDDDNDGIPDSEECNGTELISNFDLTDEGTGNSWWIPNWTISNRPVLETTDGVRLFRDDDDGVNSQTFSQNITGFRLNEAAENQINISLATSLHDGSGSAAANTFTVSYAGTDYAEVDIPTSYPGNAVITYLNGASGNLTSIIFLPSNTGTPQDLWEIYLPASIPISGTVTLSTSPASGGRAGDVTIGSINIYSCDDADGDGVVNTLDLDSDNDGIFDVNEAGHTAADGNDDGIIDGTPSDFGTNGLFDLLETAVDNGILNYSVADSENSPDGTYDAYELDSDGDACFDAYEADVTDDDSDGIAGTGAPTVDVRGRVDSIIYTDPPNDWWQDPAINACFIEICNDGIDNNGNGLVDCYDCESCAGFASCNDNDGDGINDFCDIDDDNDGIIDLLEGVQLDTSGNNCDFPIYDFENSVLESGTALQAGAIYRYSNVAAGFDVLVEIMTITDAVLVNIDDDGGIGFQDAFQPVVRSTTPNSIADVEFNFKFVNAGTNILATNIDRIGGTAYDVDGYSDAKEGILFESPNITGIDNPTNVHLDVSGTDVRYSASGTAEGGGITADPRFRIYFSYLNTVEFNIHMQVEKGGGGGNVSRQTSLRFHECEVQDFNNILLIFSEGFDTDGDLVDNHLDLDSDNDGIFDLDEAGHNAPDANNDGIIDGADTGSGSNGLFDALETSPDNDILNYTIADSETIPDGIFDAYELDSDGDGCFDALEENVSDSDTDGIAGTGVPTVDVNGLVTSITYTDPPNNHWQDFYAGPCSIEVCDDGLDNDGDGLVDCFDCDECSSSALCNDNDGDGVGDLCDLDDDNDGITDVDEGCGSDSNISGTIGIGNEVTNTSYTIPGTTITYARSGTNEGLVYGYDAGLQGHAIRFQTTSTSNGTLNTTFSNPINSVYFKLTDFDNLENYTVNVYDENSVLYDLTVEGVMLVGSFINQSGNQFISTTSTYGGGPDIQGNDPVDDRFGSVVFYFPNKVSRIEIVYIHPEDSTIRFIRPTYCAYDTDDDGLPDHLDTDSDGDGCYDTEEEAVADSDDDGVAGTGTPTVDTLGLVTSITYAVPPNDTWQNPLLGPCLPEICDDGIDNDADGDTDCFDSDCLLEANPTILTTCDNSSMTGSGIFFLHDANSVVTAETGVTISYHATLADAQNDVNPLISPYISSDATAYVRVGNSIGCYNTALVTLNVGSKCIESCVNGIDDDGDGLIDTQDDECPCSRN